MIWSDLKITLFSLYIINEQLKDANQSAIHIQNCCKITLLHKVEHPQLEMFDFVLYIFLFIDSFYRFSLSCIVSASK